MSKKGKDQIRNINLMRFAYDIFRYSALKFQIKEQSIAVWEGSENNYGCSDFIVVVSGLILENQILLRHPLYRRLQVVFKRHLRNSVEHISELFQDVLHLTTADPNQDFMTKVIFSLATACELILFLYSENSNLFLVQLAEDWFHCFLKPNKMKFKKSGGLHKLYKSANQKKDDVPEALVNTFISAFCTDYQNSAEDSDIFNKFFSSVEVYQKKNYEKYLSPPCKESSLVVDLPRYIYAIAESPLSSKKDETSEINLPPNPGLGVPQPHEMYDFPLSCDAADSQNVPEEAVQLSKHSKKSYRERRRNRRRSSGAGVEQGIGQLSLDSSGTKQSSEENPSVSIAPEATDSHEHLGARPKVPIPKTRSPDFQTVEASLGSGQEQEPGDLNSDSSPTKRRREKRSITSIAKYLTPSDNLLESRRKIPEEYAKGCFGLHKGVFNLPSSGEQDLAQLSLDYSRTEQSIEKNPSVSMATETTQSSEILATEPKVPVESKGSSDLQVDMPNLSSSRDDSLGQSSEKNPSVSMATETTQSYELLEAEPKVAVESTGSSDLQMDKSNLSLSGEKGLGQSSEKNTSVSMDTDTTQSDGILESEPKVPVGSSDLQVDMPNLSSSGEGGLGQSSEKNPSVSMASEATQSCELLEAEPKVPVELTGSSDLQIDKPNLSPSGEKDLGHLKLDSSETKQSSEKNTDILAADDATSQNQPHESPQEPLKDHSGSSSEGETENKEIQEENKELK